MESQVLYGRGMPRPNSMPFFSFGGFEVISAMGRGMPRPYSLSDSIVCHSFFGGG